MKLALASLLLTAIPLSVVAGDSGYTVKYDGGTLPDTKAGSDLKIYIDRIQVRLVRRKTDIATIPAFAITEISYGQDAHPRFRTAGAVGILSLGIAPLSALVKSKKHFVGLTWADGDKKGGLAVQCDKDEYRGILAGLEGVAGKKAVNTDIQPSNESKIAVQREEAVHETTNGNEQPSNLLTNDSIVKLVNAGLSEDTTISIVNDQPGRYSLGVEDVVALKQAGVSEKVITAMMNKQAAVSSPVAEIKREPTTEQPQPPPAGAARVPAATNLAHERGEAGYETFSDVTTVESRTHSWPLGKGLLGIEALGFQYQCPGQATACQPSEIDVTFTRYGRGWILMHAPKEIIFSADGKRIRTNDITWDGHKTSDGVEEFFTGTISAEEFRLFIAAKDAKMEVGRSHLKTSTIGERSGRSSAKPNRCANNS